MKVHLIRTSEYEKGQFESVLDLLASFDGPLEFIGSDFEFDTAKFPFLQMFYPDFKFKYESDIKKMNFDTERGYPLSWRELFSLCDYYRNTHSIPQEDFVVLLTMRRNALNWFSHQQDKNVFVHTGDWDYYTNANPKYPIAYQVLENVMQSLMTIDSINIPNECIHSDTRGCMNDFCQNKDQILLKLRTADICPTCMNKIIEEKIDNHIVDQVHETFEGIRQELLFKQKFKIPNEPVPIKVTERKQIILPTLNNLEIRLNPLFKTVYIFYLKHPEGVRLKDLSSFKTELLDIYGRLSSADDNQVIKAKISDLISPLSSSFSQKKSKINKIITDLLGDSLAQFYRIEGQPATPFRINLPSELIQIQYK